MLDKIRELRTRHLKGFHGITLYPYQEVISDNIIIALLQNLRLTSNATEEQIKKLKLIEESDEISRQAGKTTAIVHTLEVVMIYFPKLFNLTGVNKLELGIFAPQSEQAKTDFDRLKEAFLRSNQMVKEVKTEEEKLYKEQNNAKTIVLPNGASCYIAPISQVSNPESKSLNLMIFEESQDLDDDIVKRKVWPMGSAKNAPRIYIGTAGTKLCYFRTLGLNGGTKLYFEEIVAQRRKVYEETGDARHLIYEQTVRQEITKYGLDSDEIQNPYFGKWLIGTGNFTTEADIDKLMELGRERWNPEQKKIMKGELRLPTFHSKKVGYCFAGIDTAKHPDSTVVTILRWNPELKRKEIINWMELRGENYKDQFDLITSAEGFLSHYNIMAIAIDSTGQGDFMPDMFEKETEWADENSGLYRIKFSAVSKDALYKNLKVTIQELLTTLPNLSTKNGVRFKQQMLDLQQKHVGQLLSVKHPDDPTAHDDYPDSWALAEWAFAKWNEDNNISVAVINASPDKQRDVNRNENDEITDYWPGE